MLRDRQRLRSPMTGRTGRNPRIEGWSFRNSAHSDKESLVRTVLPTQVSVESRVVFADIGHCMDARTEPSPSPAPTTPSPAASGVVDVDAILRDVEALAKAAMQPHLSADGTNPTNAALDTVDTSALLNSEVSAASAAQPSQGGTVMNNGILDIGKLERELEALLGVTPSVAPSVAPSVPPSVSTNTSSSIAPDVAVSAPADLGNNEQVGQLTASSTSTVQPSVEMVIEDAMLASVSSVASESKATAISTQQVADASIEKEPIDPMLREIAAILDDTNDAMLRASDGSIDRALDTVFDARALSGQEEDVNRALIEAFGTSRRPFGFSNPDGTQASVTNPIPRFDGTSRALPPEMSGSPSIASGINPSVTPAEIPTPPRRFEEIAAQSIGRESRPEYAGETPFEPAFPAVPIADSTSVVASEQAAASTLNVQEITPKVAAKQAASNIIEQRASAEANTRSTEQLPAQIAAESSNATPPDAKPADASARTRFFGTVAAKITAGIRVVAALPLQVCALPMRYVPASFRGYITVTALSMLVWAPVAWWMAQRSTHVQGVGRIEFPVATDDKHDDAQHAASDKTGATDEAEETDDSAESGADHAAASTTTEQSGAQSADHH